MPWYYDIGFGSIILAATAPFQALALAQADIGFTVPREGTVKFVVSGSTDGPFKDIILSWQNHYLNKPGTSWYNAEIPDWEVLEVGVPYHKRVGNTTDFVDIPTRYKRREDIPAGQAGDVGVPVPEHNFVRKWYETNGVAYYGPWPFDQIHQYRFKWTEDKVDETGARQAWRRDEQTSIMYVETFVYHVRLEGAEDKNAQPLTLDYLLSVRINNPYKARFGVTDWLERLTADSNNAAKVWVGRNEYKDIISELNNGSEESGFVQALKKLNFNLPTEHEDKGAPEVIGVTVVASSLQQVELAGSNKTALIEASTKVVVATREKEAAIITAEGKKQAAILEAEGREKAIELVFTKVQQFGDLGRFLSQLDAMKATGPGDKIIWANNPFIQQTGLASILEHAGVTPQMLINAVRPNPSATPPANP